MKELKEAEFWLESAKDLMDVMSPDKEKYTVAVAQAIHSIIRANDALTLKFLKKRAMRHDDAVRLFRDLIGLNKIPSKFADLGSAIIIPAVQTKSKADYKGIEVSKAEAERWLRKAQKFIECAKECLRA
ncbi:MAG: hypothetical protein QMD78_03930 [Methanocellales archaeon]|nr:hypothetical protein [Methanocellales archaeon]